VVYEPAAKPEAVDVNKPAEPNKPDEPNKPAEPNKPEPAEPNKPEEPAEPNKPTEPNEPNEPNEPSEPMESINFKDMEMKNIIQKLAQWEGKTIMPDQEVTGKKISIYSERQVPRSQALALIYSALRAQGFVPEYDEALDTIWLKPLSDAKILMVPLVPPEVPLAAIEKKEQIVRKFFRMENYSATSMSEIVGAMLSEYAYVSADETTGKLLIIDTVKNLIHMERIIMQFDVPEAEKAVTTIFDIKHGDPGEIVQVLRMLLGAEAGGSSSRPSSRGGRRDRDRRERSGGSATSVVIGPTGGPVVLIPEPRRKWIIARASPEDTRQIEKWIDQLDLTEKVAPEYEAVQIKYAEDVEEVARRLNEVLKDMPGTEVQTSILIQPLPQARQLIIYGRKDIREIAKNLIEQIDIPSEQFETKVFKLKHADPDQIAQQIEDLYAEEEVPWWWRRRQERTSNWVKAIPLATYQQVTVIASSENMHKISKQIAEWDVPIDVDKVKPMIITLINTDPVKMAELLSGLFSEETEDWIPWWWRDEEEGREKIVGPLYGQLTFKAVPDTRKIIVISKMPEAYRVIQELIYDLDKAEMTEVPRVVKIEYADCEDLSERLNAIFSEPGASVKIRLTEKSLSKTGMASTDEGEEEDAGDSGAAGEYTPPWTGQSRRPEEMPISRVIGRIRFIPDPRSKAILVLAPKEYMEDIVKTIKELDQPGMQVRVRAVVIEINHSNVTSLGLQLADGGAFSGLDNAITVDAVSTLTEAYRHGTVTLGVGVDVTALIDFLVKTTDAKILNQQSLWMKDNEEATLFKGETVPFTGTAFTTEAGIVQSGIEYEEVGVTLRVRPNITPQRNVDMKMDLTLSQRTGEEVGGEPVRSSMITNTTAIAKDGQTIVLGGILFQQDTVTKRKIPLVGDLPAVGALFRHESTTQTNNEMLVFITPEVIDEEDMPAEAEKAEEKMTTMLEQFEGLEGFDEIE
jgi:type II secretory pathway component GspD/PulD (secretin)